VRIFVLEGRTVYGTRGAVFFFSRTRTSVRIFVLEGRTVCLQHQFLNPEVQLKGGNNHSMLQPLVTMFCAICAFHRLMTRSCVIGETFIFFFYSDIQPNIWKHAMVSTKGLTYDVVMVSCKC